MIPAEAEVHTGNLTPPPQCDAVGEILAMKSLSPHDKVRQFVDQQQQQQHSLSDTMNVVLSEEPHDAAVVADLTQLPIEQTPSTEPLESSQVKRKKKSKPQKQQITRKRKQGIENGECGGDDQITLFRRSQKALRKEARHVNMREILCRSLGGIADGSSDASNPFSPTGVSQTSSTWSPSIATSITNHFLSNVQQQKKQTFERLLQKEMTSSQLSFSRLTPDDGNSIGEEVELIIGDETAIMVPPAAENDILIMDDTVTSASIDNHLFGNATATSRGFVEIDEEAEQAQSEALMRKHELWRLRQKHLREKLRAEEAASQAKSGDHHQTSRVPPSSTNAAAMSSSKTTTTSTRVSTVETDGSFDVLMMAQRSLINHSNSSSTLKLSADHMEMIRRANNFDNTSIQRVVVFETRGSNRGKADAFSSSSALAVPGADNYTPI